MKPIRTPLATPLESRSASFSKDARMVNCYKETSGDTAWVVKRPGSSAFSITPALTAGTAGGMVSFNDKLYPIVGTNFYEVTTGGASTNKGTVVDNITGAPTPTDIYTFTQTQTVPYLFFHNSTNAYTLNGNTGTFAAVTNINFPTNQIPAFTLATGCVYLDNRVYVMTTTGRIYNSASEDATSWGALDYISKQREPDGGTALAKHLNYLVAFGKYSAEFFYDNANPTGSPLARNDTAVLEIGCAAGNSVVQFEQTLVWVGQTRDTGRAVYMLEGFAPIKVSGKAVEYFLQAATMTGVRAYAYAIPGHSFYVLTFKVINVTLVYDLNEKTWYQWTSDHSGTEDCFDDEFFTSLSGVSYVLDKSSGILAKMGTSYYRDHSDPINFRVVTPLIDGNTNSTKFFSSLELIGDKVNTTVSLKHTDDDYNTWTTYRTVDMNLSRPIIRQLGKSRRRAYDVWHTDNTSLRLQGIELSVRGGTS